MPVTLHFNRHSIICSGAFLSAYILLCHLTGIDCCASENNGELLCPSVKPGEEAKFTLRLTRFVNNSINGVEVRFKPISGTEIIIVDCPKVEPCDLANRTAGYTLARQSGNSNYDLSFQASAKHEGCYTVVALPEHLKLKTSCNFTMRETTRSQGSSGDRTIRASVLLLVLAIALNTVSTK